MSGALEALVSKELDRLGMQFASQRMSVSDTRLWAIAALTESAYCLRAVRAAGLLSANDVLSLMLDATEVALGEPGRPVRVVQSLGSPDMEGKPN